MHTTRTDGNCSNIARAISCSTSIISVWNLNEQNISLYLKRLWELITKLSTYLIRNVFPIMPSFLIRYISSTIVFLPKQSHLLGVHAY